MLGIESREMDRGSRVFEMNDRREKPHPEDSNRDCEGKGISSEARDNCVGIGLN